MQPNEINTGADKRAAAASLVNTAVAISLVAVQSSQILAIGHDPETQTLAIRFKKGDGEGPLYRYANVDAELFDRFRNAESIGSFFYAEIKPNSDRYPYLRIEEPGAAELAAQAASVGAVSDTAEAAGAETTQEKQAA